MKGTATMTAIPTNAKPAKEVFEAAARKAGWAYSPAHGGWVHDDEIREGQYMVQHDAEDACALHDIEVESAPVSA